MKRRALLLIALTSLSLLSCASQKGGASSSYDQIIYEEDPAFDYELTDDETYGRAIYPDEGLRLLKEIKAHNAENGIEWPSAYRAESGSFRGGFLNIPQYLQRKRETALPEEYFAIQDYRQGDDVPQGVISSTIYRLENEQFVCETMNQVGGDPTITPSSKEEMEAFAAENADPEAYYADFLRIVDFIIEEELSSPIRPQEMSCYTLGEGSLYINVFRSYANMDRTPVREIHRIHFDHYLPVVALTQNAENILVDRDYANQLEDARFFYGEETIRGLIYE